ncbi:hypothetical protein E2C01_082361 [Portunus trituberculatus]|uniref:DUF7041 domain-containing protein n=1 Tax=Portunus trituberculatus TaxID=210409 RepID=A0A5B7IYW5_PORTR|nr:hypothetical protein [Portunus trituberculatus]
MASSDSGTATAIAFRAPPFCSQDPSLWFSLLECIFKASKITSSLTKFNHAVTQLSSDVLPQVSAVISTAATADKPYEELKTAVLKSLQTSVATRLRELLSKEKLGDKKPSQLLHRMKQLLGDKYQSFDAELFKQQLPPAIQCSLFSVKDNLHPDAIATLADDYMATLPPSQASSVSAVSSGSSHSSQMTHLTELVSQLKQQLRDRPRSRSVSLRRRQHMMGTTTLMRGNVMFTLCTVAVYCSALPTRTQSGPNAASG